MAHIDIITKNGNPKQIKGYPRSLQTKVQVKEMFDLVREREKNLTFHGVCKKVAYMFGFTPYRIYQIMRHDFEY
jgi:hypothetical protein